MTTAERLRSQRVFRLGLAFLGILVIGVNLRVSFISVSPLLQEIGADQGLSRVEAGLLTSLPLIAFAAFSPLAPRTAVILGLDRALWLSLLLLTVGILARSAPIGGAIWAGTALLGIAIAALNVLLPSLVKRDFPLKISQITGIYTAAQSTVAAAGAALVVPVAHMHQSGWRLSLGIWAGLSLISMAVLLPRLIRQPILAEDHGGNHMPCVSPWKTSLGWQVSLFMGLQLASFYVLMTWLPSIERSRGVSETDAGIHVSLFLLVNVLANLMVGGIVNRFRDLKALALTCSAVQLFAYTGLALVPAWSLIWVVLAALGSGSLIVIALSLFSLRTENHTQAAALSGMGQSIGYGLAAISPVAFGAAYEWSGNWTVPLGATAGSMVFLCLLAVLVGRNRPADRAHTTK